MDTETEALMANIGQPVCPDLPNFLPGLPPEIGAMAKSIQDPGILADMIASTINSTPEKNKKFLELIDITNGLRSHANGQSSTGDSGPWQQDSEPGQGRHLIKSARILPASAVEAIREGTG